MTGRRKGSKGSMKKGRLRHGFTTGSAAAAATKAALLCLLGKKVNKESVKIPLPEEGNILIPVERVYTFDGYTKAVVIKDGGDDPDSTHRARISSIVRLVPGSGVGRVIIKGGKGVGRVTKPGLPIPPGEPAINPGPRKQLQKVVQECFLEAGAKPMTVEVTIEVADGEKIAQKTMNPRLGIVGGISILGTRGTVIPFSNEAYEETITLSLDVARALNLQTIILCTGGKSERFIRALFPELPEETYVQVADFFAFGLKEAAERRFRHVFYGCFFGKLVKLAQGQKYTHAKTAMIDFPLLGKWCREAGMAEHRVKAIVGANTARHVLEMIWEDRHRKDVVQSLIHKALMNGARFISRNILLEICVFAFDGSLLGRLSTEDIRKIPG